MQDQQSNRKNKHIFNLIIISLAIAASVGILITAIIKELTGLTTSPITFSECTSSSYYSLKYGEITTQLLAVFIFNDLALMMELIAGIYIVLLRMKGQKASLRSLCIKCIINFISIQASVVVFGKSATFIIQFNNLSSCNVNFDSYASIIILSLELTLLLSTILQFLVLAIDTKRYFQNLQKKYKQQSATQQYALERQFYHQRTLNNLRNKDKVPFKPAIFNQNVKMRFAPQREKPKQLVFQSKQSYISKAKLGDKSSDHFSRQRIEQVLDQPFENNRQNIRRAEPFLAAQAQNKPIKKINQYMQYFEFLNNSSSQKQNFEDLQGRIKEKYQM